MNADVPTIISESESNCCLERHLSLLTLLEIRNTNFFFFFFFYEPTNERFRYPSPCYLSLSLNQYPPNCAFWPSLELAFCHRLFRFSSVLPNSVISVHQQLVKLGTYENFYSLHIPNKQCLLKLYYYIDFVFVIIRSVTVVPYYYYYYYHY